MKTKLEELEEKKRKLELKVEKYKRENKIEISREKELLRKKRAHKLIKLGALFEICNLLGYLSKYHALSDDEKKSFFLLGEEILVQRKKKSKSKKKECAYKSITTEQILELIKLARAKDIDIVFEMQKRFKKKLLEHLTFEEFEYLKKFLIGK